VLGNIVGVMIFLTPAEVAKHLPWDGWFLAAWAIGGALALLGALCLAELGAMLPKAGGDYVYIREAYGEALAFLSGWTSVVITFPGSIAAMAVGLCFYQGAEALGPVIRTSALQWTLGDLTYEVSWAQVLALVVIALLTAINHLGVRLAGWVQAAIISGPIVLMLAAGAAALFVDPSGPVPEPVRVTEASPWLGLFPALVPIFFAYAGWNATTYIGGEIHRPGRNIPRSLIIGTALAVLLYLIVCWVFLHAIPAAAMPSVPFVPAVALGRLFGPSVASLISLVIMLAVLSSLNATILGGSRISLAMAGHGLAFASLRRLSPRFATPVVALWVQAGLAMVLVLSGRFEQLVAYVVAVMLVFSSIAVAATIVLRVRRPDAPRPYRTWGYPAAPAVFVAFNLAVIAFLLCRQASRAEAVWGLVITLFGLPAFAWVKRRRQLGSALGTRCH
jgi:APA family basic amino acid/polyamine antiporter